MKKLCFFLFVMLFYSTAVDAQQGGYALRFDGTDDYVNCGAGESLNIIGAAITIEAWIYTSNIEQNWQAIGGKQNAPSGAYSLIIEGSTKKPAFWFATTSSPWSSKVIANTVLQQNQWYHIAGTYDGSNARIYVNGKLENSTALNGNIVELSTVPLYIGRNNNVYFNGMIDEFRIWNISRTEAEIKANMYKEIGTHPSLKAYYKMSDGTGTTLTDNSGNSNSGTLTNSPAWKISGCLAGARQALEFDGTNEYITFGYNSALVLTSAVSLEAWVKLNSTTTQDFVAGKIVHGGSNYGYGMYINNGNLGGESGQITFIAGRSWNEWPSVRSIARLEAGKWYHIVGTFDGRYLRIYVNGKLDNTYDRGSTYSMNDSGDNFKIAYCSSLGNNYFNGAMDEVRVWNSAINENQIIENMFKTLAGNETGLAAYWRFDQMDGTVLYDLTSNESNGSLNNMEATDWVTSTAFNTWIGSESNNWATAANWSNGVPASAQSIGIFNWSSSLPNVTTYLPVLPATVSVNNLLLPSGVSTSGNVNLTATGSAFLGSNLTLSSSALNTAGNIVIDNGKALTLPASAQLTVSGTLTNNAGNSGLVIESGASLLHNSSGVAATVKREITGSSSLTANKYHFVAIPTQYASPTSELFLGSYLYKLDPSQQETTNSNYYGKWVGLGESTTTPLNLNEGYMVYYPGNSIEYTFSGDLNNGSYSPALSGHSSTYTFNLIPNPYPSAIDWGASSGWTRSSAVGGTAYIWNSGSGNYTSVANSSGNYIPAGQGFIVAVYNSNSPAISMNNSVRAHSSQPFYKSGQEINTLRIEALANNYKDETVIAFTEEATETFDLPSDGLKLFGLAEAPQLYTTAQGEEKYSINQLPPLTGNREVPLYFETEFTGEIVLNSSGTESFEEDLSIYLKDKLTGQTLNLRTNSEYRFQHNPVNSKDRFSLIFGGTIGLDEPAAENISSWFSGNTFYLSTPEYAGEKAKVEVFSVSGQLLFSREVTLSNLQQFNLNAKGAVITRITLNNKVLNTKAIVL